MKVIIYSIFLFMWSLPFVFAQNNSSIWFMGTSVELNYANAYRDITLKEGQKFSITSWARNNGKVIAAQQALPEINSANDFRGQISENNLGGIQYFSFGAGDINGPCFLRIFQQMPSGTSLGQTILNYTISGNDSSLTEGSQISATSVVVPANATGDVDVLLEQSTDMITWTQCLPGTYNASTQKRFFRVRAVEK